MTTTVTIRLEDGIKEKLEKLADATNRSRSFLAAEAIRAYVETNEWQIHEIQQALLEADAGDFASEQELQAVTEKWRHTEPG
ncbi:ribbon-helix-helix protein, CopG family [Pseudomethylobacillus aquaticus]|uniref:Ribbon-helix-helix protein, CopG family n=1 Tax=Pseudomethylobacillus aquaticus TaxID=2676064 RepID=A0A3N0V6X4_9PROT|nr:CopG family ribbon-helix-helix protein [Pseudomethylobacillus aquaticus]ROH88372.1 ribbon-helix-helix protein, CopG family [Pseudomethylobacillus aquaticus]